MPKRKNLVAISDGPIQVRGRTLTDTDVTRHIAKIVDLTNAAIELFNSSNLHIAIRSKEEEIHFIISSDQIVRRAVRKNIGTITTSTIPRDVDGISIFEQASKKVLNYLKSPAKESPSKPLSPEEFKKFVEQARKIELLKARFH